MKHGKSPYTTTFYLWNGVAAFFYSAHVTSFHSHNTMQVVLDTHTGFRFRVKGAGWSACKSLIIDENVVHKLDTSNSVLLIIYLDPNTTLAAAIKTKYLGGSEVYPIETNVFHFVNADELERAMLSGRPALLEKIVKHILEGLALSIPENAKDERVAMAEQFISGSYPATLAIKDIAEKACLSESRLRALFKQTTGISLYRYMLWNKIRYATNQIMAGSSVSDAALAAGFTDSSHFHKMMVKMFGISPSGFLKNNAGPESLACADAPLKFETYTYPGRHGTEHN